jgi:ribosomal protein S18 acetylase RimI-like enzyme
MTGRASYHGDKPRKPAIPALAPRLAISAESRRVADLWLASRRASIPQIPPPTHGDDDVRDWFEHVVFPSFEVWVFESAGEMVALMILSEEWIEQLHVHPDWTGRGLGSRLVDLAKQRRPSLDLWTFESNDGAKRFYERHGFVGVACTDGDNEEGAPDVRYHWPPA